VSNVVDGTFQIVVGGSEESFARWRDLLAPMGTLIHVGPTGAGAAMKLVANSSLVGLMSLIGEALALADGFGLDQQTVVPVLLDSPAEQQGFGGYDYSPVVAHIRHRKATG
jgi:3-hydroxyisobutyrate dehydrogenase-like beta-hydroxyacid dehydrogenase